MRKLYIGILLLGLMIGLPGCTYIGNMGDSDNSLDERIEYTEDLGKYDQLVLKVDLSVSEIKLSGTDGKNLSFVQKANREDLLAEMFIESKGSTVEVTFKNKDRGLLNGGNQNSTTEIMIPEHLLVELDLDVNVGNLTLKNHDLAFSSVEASLDVGALDFVFSNDQPELEEVLLSTDVGEVNLTLSESNDSLKKVKATSDVGSVDADLSGTFSQALTLEGSTNVGSVSFDLSGTFNEEVLGKFDTDTGDLTLTLPEDSPVTLETDISEHTSSLSIKTKDYTISGKQYLFNENANKGKMTLKASTDIGDLTIR